MLHFMTEDEVKAYKERLTFLHTSPYVADNLTANLIDSAIGESGMEETAARQKVSRIISYLGCILNITLPARRDNQIIDCEQTKGPDKQPQSD